MNNNSYNKYILKVQPLWVVNWQKNKINSKILAVSIKVLSYINLVSEKELKKLYKNFSKIDKDKSGSLEPEEFFDIPGNHTHFH